jgi:hypothetical protein
MSTGLPAFLATRKLKPAVSMLITGMRAEFYKKATEITFFSFADVNGMNHSISEAIQSGEGITYEAVSIGRSKEGKEIARFYFTWSFRIKIS